jgi:hypothetical protein
VFLFYFLFYGIPLFVKLFLIVYFHVFTDKTRQHEFHSTVPSMSMCECLDVGEDWYSVVHMHAKHVN